jgi:hypothetical protein
MYCTIAATDMAWGCGSFELHRQTRKSECVLKERPRRQLLVCVSHWNDEVAHILSYYSDLLVFDVTPDASPVPLATYDLRGVARHANAADSPQHPAPERPAHTSFRRASYLGAAGIASKLIFV